VIVLLFSKGVRENIMLKVGLLVGGEIGHYDFLVVGKFCSRKLGLIKNVLNVDRRLRMVFVKGISSGRRKHHGGFFDIGLELGRT
jgi:hypothetical protein